jgi:hypothetical protein
MTLEEKRMAIAESRGASWFGNVITFRSLEETKEMVSTGDGCARYTEYGMVGTDVPDYFGDLNTIVGAAAKSMVTPSQQQEYAELLQKQVRWICFASAAQHAEAYGLVMGLWKTDHVCLSKHPIGKCDTCDIEDLQKKTRLEPPEQAEWESLEDLGGDEHYHGQG